MPKIRWKISFETDEAAADVASMFATEDIADEIKRILRFLWRRITPPLSQISSG